MTSRLADDRKGELMVGGRSWMTGLLATIALSLAACTGVQDLTVLKTVPPHDDDVRIRLGNQSSYEGEAVFTAAYQVDAFKDGASMPSQSQIAEMKALAQKHGARSLVVDCGAPGTVGSGKCRLTGYE